MSNISISLGKHSKGSIRLKNFQRTMPKNLKRGFVNATAFLERHMKKIVSGPGRIRKGSNVSGPFSSLNDYPGVVSGRFRASIGSQVKGAGESLQGRTGPNVDYAEFLEDGTRKMQPYPFLAPTWDDKGEKAIDFIQREISGPLGF